LASALLHPTNAPVADDEPVAVPDHGAESLRIVVDSPAAAGWLVVVVVVDVVANERDHGSVAAIILAAESAASDFVVAASGAVVAVAVAVVVVDVVVVVAAAAVVVVADAQWPLGAERAWLPSHDVDDHSDLQRDPGHQAVSYPGTYSMGVHGNTEV